MADIKLTALTEVDFDVSKESVRRLEGTIAGLLRRANVPHKLNVPLEPEFNFSKVGRQRLINQLDEVYRQLERRVAAPDLTKGLEQQLAKQQQLVRNMQSMLEQSSALSRGVRTSGERAIRELERGTDFRSLTAARQESARRVLAERELQATQLRKIESQAAQLIPATRDPKTGELAGGSAFLLPGLREQRKSLEKSNKALAQLTDVDRLLAEDKKKRAAAEREAAKAEREREADNARRQRERAEAERESERKRRDADRARQSAAKTEVERAQDFDRAERERRQQQAGDFDKALAQKQRQDRELARLAEREIRDFEESQRLAEATRRQRDEVSGIRRGQQVLDFARQQGISLDRIDDQRLVDAARSALEAERDDVDRRIRDREAGRPVAGSDVADRRRLNEIVGDLSSLRVAQRRLKAATDTRSEAEKAAARQAREDARAAEKRRREVKKRQREEAQAVKKRRREARQLELEQKRHARTRRKAIKRELRAHERSAEVAERSSQDLARLRDGQRLLRGARQEGFGSLTDSRSLALARQAIEDERARLNRIQDARAIRGEGPSERATARLAQLDRELKQLQATQRQLGRQTRETTEAIQRQAAADRRRESALEQAGAVEARRRRGQVILDQFGGPGAVQSIPREQLGLATEAIQGNIEELKRKRDALLAAGRATGDLDERITELNDSLRLGRARLGGMGSAVKEFGLLFRQFLRLGVGFGVIFEILFGVRALITELVTLDRELKNIQAIAGATASEMLLVEGAIKRVALSTKFSTGEIAKAAQVLAQAGVDPSQITGVLASVAQFASATEASIQTAADLVSSMRNVFKELDDTTIANQLTRAVNISKTTADDLKSIVSFGAQTARRFNLTGEQFLAAAATLRNAGIRASTVGTGLRRGLMEVFEPDDQTIAALKNRYAAIGEELTNAAIRERFFSFTQQTSPLIAVLKELRRLGFAEGPGKLDFAGVFDIRAQNALTALVSNLQELEANEARVPFSNAAINASRTQMESLANSAKNLGAAITAMSDSIAAGALPAIEDLTDGLTNAIEKITRLNDKMVAETGIGLGTILTGGALSATVGFFGNRRGSITERLGKAAASGVIGTTVGQGLQSSTLSTGANQALGLFSGVVATQLIDRLVEGIDRRAERRSANRAAAQTAAARFTTAPRFTPVYRGTGYGINRTVNTAAAVANVAAVGGAMSGIVAFLDRVGSAFTGLFAKIPWIGRVASFLPRVLNPLIGGIATIAAVLGVGAQFFRETSLEDIERQFDQATRNFNSAIADYEEQLRLAAQFKLSESGIGAKRGTAAELLERLETEAANLETDLEQFFGGTVTDIAGVGDILERLANEGAVAGSQAEADLIEQLARRVAVAGSQSGELLPNGVADLTSRRGELADLATRFSEMNTQTRALQEQTAQYLEQLSNAEGEIEPFQQAMLDFVNEADNARFRFFTGQSQVGAAEARRFFRDLFEASQEPGQQAAQEALDKAYAAFRRRVETLVESALAGDQPLALNARVQALFNDTVDNLGLEGTRLIGIIADEIKKRRERIRTQIERLDAVSDSSGDIRSFLRPDIPPNLRRQGEEQARGVDPRRAALEAESERLDGLLASIGEKVEDRTRSIAESNERVLRNAESLARQLADAYNNNRFNFRDFVEGDEISEDQRNRINKVLHRREDGSVSVDPQALVTNEDGKLQSSDRSGKLQKLLDDRAELFNDQLSEAEKIFRASEALQRQLIALDADLAEAKRLNLRAEDLKALHNQRQAVLLKQLANREAHLLKLREAETDPVADKQLAIELQNLRVERARLEADHNETIAALNQQAEEHQRELNRSALDFQKQLIDREFKDQLGRTDSTREDFRRLDERRAANLEAILANEEAKLKAQRVEKTEIDRQLAAIREANRSYFEQGDVLVDITRSLGAVRDALEAKRVPTPDTTGEAREQALGRGYSSADREAQLEDYLDKQQAALDEIHASMRELERRKRAQGDLTAEETDDYEKLRDLSEQFAVNIGEAQANLVRLNQTSAQAVSDGFSLEKLKNGLEDSEAATKHLAGTIRNELIRGINGVGAALIDARREGKSFGDTMDKVISQIFSKIADAIANNLINTTVTKGLGGIASIFSTLGSAFGGGGGGQASSGGNAYANALLGAATGASDLRDRNGGVIHGPGSGTSDSIPGYVVDSKTGKKRFGLRVSDQEAILNAKAVDLLGREFIDSINRGEVVRMATGGVFGRPDGRNTVSPAQIMGHNAERLTREVGQSRRKDERPPTPLRVEVSEAALNSTLKDWLEGELARIRAGR